MYYSFLFCLIAAALAFWLKDGDNFIYRKSVELAKVEAPMQKQMDELSGPKTSVVCRLDTDFDFRCAAAADGSRQQFPIYFWGAPGAQTPRVDTAENCAKSCAARGPGFCVWRENGPEYKGGTSCYFVSPEICSNSSLASIKFSSYLPSQVKSIRSGRCQ